MRIIGFVYYTLVIISSIAFYIEAFSVSVNKMSGEFEHSRWENYWDKGLNPGEMWDMTSSSPLLIQYVNTPGVIPNGRALVPGCGRGYDLITLASPEREVIGLDISPSAVQVAENYLAAVPDSEFPHRNRAQVQCRSFFALDPATNAEDQFDFVYDYTFLCALDPSIRNDWARKMGEIVKPGGLLLTLIYPILKEEKVGGPPFQVSLNLVEDLLIPNGFERLELGMLDKDLCHKGRDGGLDGNGPFSGVGRWRKL